MNSKFILWLLRMYGWKLWVGSFLVALLLVEAIVAVLDMLFYGQVQGDDMIKGLVATAIVEPTYLAFLVYLLGEFSKGKLNELESNVAYANQRFRFAIEISQVQVWELDIVKGELIYDDDTLEVLGVQTDRAPHDLAGWLVFVHPDDRAAFMARYQLVLPPGGAPFDLEYRVAHPDGKWGWLHTRGEVSRRDAQGNPLWAIGSTLNVTSRKNAEAQLSIAAVAFESQEGMVVTDAEAKILRVNKAFTSITGYSQEDVLGKNPRMLASGKQDKNFYRAMWDSIRATGAWKGELWNRRKNGEEYSEFLMITAVKDQNGRVSHYVGALTDSSERRMALEQLRSTAANLEQANAQVEQERALLAQRVEERTRQLRYANQAKDSFLATMSHEIRTPLGGLLGMMELLDMSNLDREQSEMLAAAHQSGKSLLRIVDDILDWSRIEAKKLVLVPQIVSVEEMLKGVVSTYAPLAVAKGIALRLDMQRGALTHHYFDALRVSQILNNFTSNAIKFTDRGEVVVRVEWLGTHQDLDRVRFSVKDSGIGISPEQQRQLFNHYEQASADTARMYGGTGLGLSICRSLAELLDGSIEVASVPKVGSTFSFNISLRIAKVAVETVERQRVQSQAADAGKVAPLVMDGQEVSVLVVDDHPLNRMLLKQQLERLGLHVEVAADGVEALSLWQAERFDLVITDCHMPEMDGYELTRRIRAAERDTASVPMPIIAWTANALSEEVMICRSAGMDDLMTKPTDMAVLKAMLLKWLVKAKVIALPDANALPSARIELDDVLSAAVLDMSVLKKISTRHESQVELLHEFNKENRLDIANLKTALQAGDPVAVARSAHRIKGASRMVGALQLETLSSRIETLAKQEELEEARVAADSALDEVVRRLEAAVESVLLAT